jgi:pantothenate kinase
MIQVSGSHVIGALITLLATVGGGAFTVYDRLSAKVERVEVTQEADRELLELKLEHLADTQAEILEEVKNNRNNTRK